MGGFSGSIGSIWVEIGARIDSFKQGLAQIEPSIKNTLVQMEGLAKIGDTMGDVGRKLSIGLTAPMVAFAGYALKASGDFDTAMRTVSARGDITGEALAKLKQQAEDLGAATKFSSKQAAEGMEDFAGAGFNAEQIFAAMPGTMSLAAAATVSVADAAKITKDTLGQFGLAASDSAKVADILAKAGNESSGSIRDMATTLTYVGPVARGAGLDLEQTSAAILSLDKAGIRGSQAGTGLRTMLLSLQAPTDKARALMEQLGITVTDASGKLLPFPQIVENVTAGLDKLGTQSEKSGAMVTLFGKYAVSAAQALTANGAPALVDFENKLRSAAGEADRTANVMNAGFGGAMEKMKGSIETAAQKIGDVMAPAAIALAGAIETAANKVAEFAGYFAKLPAPIQEVVGVMLALTAALGPALVASGFLVEKVAAVTAALAQLAPQTLLAEGAVTKLGLAKSALATIAQNLLAPALIAVSAALVGMQVVQVHDEIIDLSGAMEDGIKSVVGSTNAFTDFGNSLLTVFNLAGQTNTGLSSINFGKVGQDANAAGKETGYLADVMDRLQKVIANFRWTDFLTPLGAIRSQLAQVTDTIRTLTGVWPTMEKAGSDSLKKVQDANTASMRAAADNAMQVVNLGKAHAENNKRLTEAATVSRQAADETSKHSAAQERQQKVVEPLTGIVALLTEQWRVQQQTLKSSTDEAIKWLAAHSTLESRTPKLTTANEDLNKSIQEMVSSAKLVGPAFKENTSAIDDAAKRMKDLDEAYKTSGQVNIAVLEEQAAKAKEAYDMIASDARASLETVQGAWENYQEKQAAVIFESGGELPKKQQGMLDKFEQNIGDSGEKQKSAWTGIMQQVSTIITDAGKNIVDKFFSMGEYNAKLDEQANTLKASLEDRQKSYDDFAAGVQQSLADANGEYQATIEKEAEQLRQNLEERKADYDDYVKEIAGKLDEVRQKHDKEAAKERQDILNSLDDRTQDYNDYQDDIKDKIGKIRGASAKNQEKERKDLVDSLADKKLDYDRYVEDVQVKLKRIRDKNKGQFSDEEADLLKSLQRRTEDFQAYQAENFANQQGLGAKYAAAQAADEDELNKSLARRTRDFQEYQDDVKNKLDAVTQKHAEEQAKEEADLNASLDKKRAALDKYTADATQKAEDVNQAARDKLDAATGDLQKKLSDQTAEWEKYKNDVASKLDDISSKHRSVFSEILHVGVDVFTELGAAVGRFVSEQLVGLLFKQLGNLVDDILPGVGKALDGVLGKLGGLSKGVGDVAGDASSAGADAAKTGTGAGTGTGAAGAATTGIMGTIGAIGSAVSAISGVIGNFQNAHQETSLNAIEHNTRYSMMYLGERGDGGILGRLFDIADKTQYLPGLLDGINLKMDEWLQPIGPQLQKITDNIDLVTVKLTEVSVNTQWGSKAEQDNGWKLEAMLGELRKLTAQQPIINVYVNGEKSASPASLKMQGVIAL